MADLRGWFNYRKVYDWVSDPLSPFGRSLPPPRRPRFVEVGVWKGASLIYLCNRLRHSYRDMFSLFAVDSWLMQPIGSSNGGDCYNRQISEAIESGVTILDIFLSNLSDFDLDPFVEVVHSDSVFASSLVPYSDFVFIDASHETSSVISDIESWRHGASVLAGHDAYQDSVKSALEYCFGHNGYWSSVDSGGCWTTDPCLGEYIVSLSSGTPFQDCIVEKGGHRVYSVPKNC